MKCLYVIGNKSKDVCKIGISTNPDKRLKQLQTGCPYKLSILAIVKGMDYESERNLHKRYSEYRINGEWFRIRGEIKKLIGDKKENKIKPSPKVKEIPPVSDINCYRMTKRKKRGRNQSKHIKRVLNPR